MSVESGNVSVSVREAVSVLFSALPFVYDTISFSSVICCAMQVKNMLVIGCRCEIETLTVEKVKFEKII